MALRLIAQESDAIICGESVMRSCGGAVLFISQFVIFKT